ncbi:MAG: hypothetical protein NT038_09765 [Euryarchaeota archaeon]|nr:hypothetical protein [Euryarchaeota archaeon]
MMKILIINCIILISLFSLSGCVQTPPEQSYPITLTALVWVENTTVLSETDVRNLFNASLNEFWNESIEIMKEEKWPVYYGNFTFTPRVEQMTIRLENYSVRINNESGVHSINNPIGINYTEYGPPLWRMAIPGVSYDKEPPRVHTNETVEQHSTSGQSSDETKVYLHFFVEQQNGTVILFS